jgi:hypothetical protein
MKAIWKFVLQAVGIQRIFMPRGAKILTVREQRKDTVCLWAEVDTDARPEERVIEAFGTGHQMDTDIDRKYVGTVILQDGALVFHIYERLS